MRLELVTIGDELLLGYTVDTNAAFLARVLSEIGVEIVRRETVADDAEAIAAAVREALDRTGAIITTGGLGPTADDRTRPAIAALFGRALHRDDAVLERVSARFRAIHARMPPSNVVQAMVPDGAIVLDNRHGTAPGLWLEDDRGRWVAMLPGVPREMRGLTVDAIIPLLRGRLERTGAPTVVLSRTIRTTGIGESALAERLGELGGDAVDGIPLAFLPGWEGVDLRLTVRGRSPGEASRALDGAAAKLCERAGRYVYGSDGDDLAAIVLELCRLRGLHIATGESCTGGMLGERLTAIPGASAVYVGGVVAYDDAVKMALLGVSEAVLREHGAVGEATAAAMAAGARAVTGAEIGAGITGIAGPDGGTPEKPVGTVCIATDVRGEVRALVRVYTGDRQEIRRRSTQAALDLIRRMLLGID